MFKKNKKNNKTTKYQKPPTISQNKCFNSSDETQHTIYKMKIKYTKKHPKTLRKSNKHKKIGKIKQHIIILYHK